MKKNPSAGKKILIAYTDAGGGHKATAEAIKAVLEDQTCHRVDLMNPYKELIADVDLFARLSPFTDEEVYNRFVLGKGWNNLFCLVYYAATLLNVRLGTRESVRRFAACWKERGYDMVISVMPMSNQGLYQSVRSVFKTRPVPFLVVMTDFAESMKYTWFPRERDYFAVCPDKKMYKTVLSKPHSKRRIFQTSGLVVHPNFYEKTDLDPEREQERLGLTPGLATGCIMYGGGGSVRMADIARALARISETVQIIFLCGRNQALADQLRSMALPYPHLIKTFTRKVPYYFRISDFLVGKPGPGTISEALVSGILPIVDQGFVLPQERYNLSWLKAQKKGLVFNSIPELLSLIQTLDPAKNAQARHQYRPPPSNRAVFELPAIVNQILKDCHGC